MARFAQEIKALQDSIRRAIVGKDDIIDQILTTLLAQGHVLIEDVPGVGKTTLALALARSIDGALQRIQFTSDLLPSDVIGTTIFNAETRGFEFKPGPVFANILLADEINRTTPKTQSSLLEAMHDASVTVDRTTHILPKPFMVIATQNPIEFHGTYPLPESQLDRFLMKIAIGYPSADSELFILKTKGRGETAADLTPVVTLPKVLEMQKAATEVRVDEAISKYMIGIVSESRKNRDLELGASTRGALALYRAVQARAIVMGREYVIPDDVKALLVPVLSHRIIINARRQAAPGSKDAQSIAAMVIGELASSVEAPV